MIYGKLSLQDLSEGSASLFDLLSCISKYSVVDKTMYIEKDTLLRYFQLEKGTINSKSKTGTEKKKRMILLKLKMVTAKSMRN